MSNFIAPLTQEKQEMSGFTVSFVNSQSIFDKSREHTDRNFLVRFDI